MIKLLFYKKRDQNHIMLKRNKEFNNMNNNSNLT